MELDGVPEKFVDTLVQEFAYDPIRLKDDPAQMLYDRRTLETIWDTNHDALNPYTRQPFDIADVVPQAELRKQMSQYIRKNRTLGLEVIPDYTNILSTRDMKNLLNELGFRHRDLDFHCSAAISAQKTGNMNEEKYWKALWKKLNLLRLHCQYRAENRETFSSLKGYEYFFMVADEPLLKLCRKYYSLCDYAKHVCREAARIVDIVGLKYIDLRTVPDNSLWGFVHILNDLGELEYLKIQSMVLRIYRMMFFDCLNFLTEGKIFCNCVVETTLSLLGRQNTRDITNEDLYNGSAILKAGWIKDSFLVLDCVQYVDVLVNVVIICISRFQNQHTAAVHHAQFRSHNTGNDQAIDIHKISMSLDQGLSLIDALVREYPNDRYRYADERERLQTLDIVKEIVRMVELVLSGFKFMEPSHFRIGLNIARALYKQGGHNVIRKNDVKIFRKFLGNKNVDEYGKRVKTLLRDVIADADAADMKYRNSRVNRYPGNRSYEVTNRSRALR